MHCTVRDSRHRRKPLGIKPTALPWFTLCAGFAGITVALTMEYWMNAVSYPYIISGKPYASWPAFIPVAFELTVLFVRHYGVRHAGA
ncbi:MAG: quinol:electron acceptor oxidoreductase subunit ActD [Pirellulaceae bacterium]